jgi:hypothetical protein
MDLRATIRELYEEKQRIEEAIASLEELLGAKGRPGKHALEEPPRKGRRGRKEMSPEERLVVSSRMKQYWAKRRAARMVKASGGSGA